MPGMKQYRGRRFNPYLAFRSRRPFPPPYFYSPYGYGYVLRIMVWVCTFFPLLFFRGSLFALPHCAAERLLGSEGQTVTCHTIEDDISAQMVGFVSWTNLCWNFFVFRLTLDNNVQSCRKSTARCIPYVIFVVLV